MNNDLSNEEIYRLIKKALVIISILIEEPKVTGNETSLLNIAYIAMNEVLASQQKNIKE